MTSQTNTKQFHVNDTSDEDFSLPFCHDDSEFRCPGSGRCIPREWVVDGKADCVPGGEDEERPLGRCDATKEFRCGNGRCVPRYRVRDGYPDCPDSSDEAATLVCNKLEFECKVEGRCIPKGWVGNNIVDCHDSKADELIETLDFSCSENEFLCEDQSRCIPKKFVCDGIKNCRDCSDEVEACNFKPTMFR